MAKLNGIEVMKSINRMTTQPKVFILTQFDDKILISHMLELGVDGFLLKNCQPSELKDCILKVHDKGFYLNRLAKEALIRNRANVNSRPNLSISKREMQVLKFIKDGLTNKEISTELNLSLRTVESYRKSLMKKTGSHSAADIIGLVNRTGVF